MFKPVDQRRPRLLQFLLLQRFSMLAFTSAVEPLRTANRLAGQTLYDWEILTTTGTAAVASNGIHVLPDSTLGEERPDADAVVVCAGLGMEGYDSPEVTRWLRRHARRGVPVGGLCTGPLALAAAGLLKGYRCTIHWENVESFVEQFPDLAITATLYEIDRDRFTCAGGTSALDMMIAIIREEHGRALAVRVADALIHTGLRHPEDPQRVALRERIGVSDPKVLAAIAHMEAHLENPVPVEVLASQIRVSHRQLERLFQKHLGASPSRYYLRLRLQRARSLLAQTSMTVLQVAVACGFSSASHFSKCYRQEFGQAPRRWRLAPEPLRTTPTSGTAPSAPLPDDAPADVVDVPLAVELDVLNDLDPAGERATLPDPGDDPSTPAP
ncbi:helix-turn-helix domain-containing protein [Roseospira marina]|uniref:Helix-turn-helix domain-containing protein n=1 Tax=Roseospira marina TaxID=140057 RepID=A0A5M6IH13_9PROT|nr:GlxA family transcriptional regulator [Roseospira marina]KAA5607452.1 helix-turn-helix domain-containing protein [Roseospira marina]MBB4312368.1 transcriptional regulator GlxA family with amidase domain [Roseospira marina]MBB5085616.1 transcriptional regulator GlxA family with amidase domain [Roseospira marina]